MQNLTTLSHIRVRTDVLAFKKQQLYTFLVCYKAIGEAQDCTGQQRTRVFVA